MRRATLLALGLAAIGSVSPAHGAGAEPPAPLLLFYTAEPGPIADAALRALEELAARRATVVIDLSPEQPAPPASTIHLRRGIEAYRDFDYPGAREQLDAGLAEASASGARGLTSAELSDLLLYRALVYGQLGDETRAWDDFVRAATVDPTRVLDPVRFPPRVIQTLERAVAATAAAHASLHVAAAPGCAVTLDARPVAPATAIPVIRGEHYLRVECPGARPYASLVLVHDQEQRLTPARVDPAVPSDAELIAEAGRRGATATIVTTIATSSHGVTATLRHLTVPGGEEQARTVIALAGDGVAGAIAGAATRLIDLTRPAPVVIPPRPRRWYHNRWLWAAAGAAVTAAVLLPLVFDPGPATGFDVAVDYPR